MADSAELHAELQAHLKSIELNMVGGFSAVNKRLDTQNSTIAHLNEAEVRRDEREKTVAAALTVTTYATAQKMAAAHEERLNIHWWIGAGIAAAGVLSGIVAVIVPRL